MEIHTDVIRDSLVIYCKGSLDLPNQAQLRSVIMGALNNDRKGIIVELSNVDFIDSSGLGVLIAGHRKSKEKGAKMVIAQATRHNRLFTMGRLDKVFHLRPTIREALEFIGS